MLEYIKLPNNLVDFRSDLSGCSPDIILDVDKGGSISVKDNCIIDDGVLLFSLDKTSIPEGVETIAVSFSDSPVEEITIPASVKRIGPYTFFGCKNLKKVTVLSSEELTIGIGAFAMCTSLESITFAEGLTTLEDVFTYGSSDEGGFYAVFHGCISLKSLHLPASVEYIPPETGTSLSGIEEFTVDEANPIYKSDGNCIIRRADNMLIAGCSGSVIPEYVEGIVSRAFNNPLNLQSIVIPNDVKLIEEDAFNLLDFTSVILPKTVQTIENSAFNNATIYTDAYSEIPEGWAQTDFLLSVGNTDIWRICTIGGNVNIYTGCVFGDECAQRYVLSLTRGGEMESLIPVSAFSSPRVPVRPGYVLVGWATESGGDAVYSVSQSPSYNIYCNNKGIISAWNIDREVDEQIWEFIVQCEPYDTSLDRDEVYALPVGTVLYAVWEQVN